MLQIFQQYGEELEISGNSPLFLNQPSQIYLVVSEYVDVFLAPLRNGRPEGFRTPLFRAQQGSLLFGVDGSGYGTDMGMLATAKPGTKVLRVQKSKIDNISRGDNQQERSEIRELVQGWIQNLTLALQQGMPPKNTTLLSSGENNLHPEENARTPTGSDLFWVRRLKGSCSLFSCSDWQLPSEGKYFPLSEYAWITAQTSSSLDCQSHEKMQDMDPGYQKYLENFHSRFFAFIQEQLTAKWENERNRLSQIEANDRQSMSSAMWHLAKVLGSKPRALPDQYAAGDDLLTACKRVGKQLGMEVRKPPSEFLINTDPLEAIAKGSGFRIRKVTLKEGWWNSDTGSMLGFLEDSQTGDLRPVALLQKSPKQLVVDDPGRNERYTLDKNTSKGLSNLAYAFYRPFPDRPLQGRDLIRHSLYNMIKDPIMLILMGLAAALLSLFIPVATGVIVDRIIPASNKSGLLLIGGVLLVTAISSALFEITRSVSMLRVVGKVDSILQPAVMDRLLSLSTSFFRRFSSGDLAERTLGINAIREILSEVTVSAVISGIFSSCSLALLFYYSWELALVALGLTSATVLFLGYIGYLQIHYQRIVQNLQGTLSGMVLQFITGISKLRVSGTEDRAFTAWANKFSQMREAQFKSGNLSNHALVFIQTMPVLSMFVIFSGIAFTPLINTLSVGSIMAFHSAFTQFQNSLTQMTQQLTSSLQAIPLYERAKPILETEPEVDANKAGPGVLTGNIEINNIYFRYEQDGPLILDDVSMEIRSGQFVAIAGSSGSGKSTLLRILLGFETPEAGNIYYDGQDLSGLDVVAVRRQLGVVLQDGQVQAGDILSNIVGSSLLGEEEAWEAARVAGLKQDIQNMPMGMQTMVPPGGGTLSGGQCQRLLIARAIVHKPRILFFDEATSALDNETQKSISENLEQLNSTRVVIAHRLSTIANADKIYVLDQGKIVQQGNYEDLINQPGLFADLAKRQLA